MLFGRGLKMRPKYTATDLFRLKKPLKLLSIIDGFDDDYIDRIFNKMKADGRGRDNLFTLFTNFKDFFDDKLPGMVTNQMKPIAMGYHHKVERRKSLNLYLKGQHLKNRLLPLEKVTYEEFGKKSREHFNATYWAFRCHIFGKSPIKGEIRSWTKEI